MKAQTTITNNILFIRKGKKRIILFVGLKRNPGAWRKHINVIYQYNKWWNWDFTLEKEWIRFALASQGNNSCVSCFMKKKAFIYVRLTLFGYVESLRIQQIVGHLLFSLLWWQLIPARGTQHQFSENTCSEDYLRFRIFGTSFVKFFACLPLLGFSNI